MSRGFVGILNHEQVSLPQPKSPPSLTKLSFFDTIWIGFPPIQRLLLYTNTCRCVPFRDIVDSLKSSISSTLLDFLPLAGKLTYQPSTGDVEINLSDPGFVFVEAEAVDIDLHRLVVDEVYDVESFLKLIPPMDTSELPFRPFALQVTRFGYGGVAIGYAVHHTVADGKAMWQFVEAWTSACKAEMSGKPQPKFPQPSYDRTVIEHPRREELAREFLRASSPNLPIARSPTLAVMDGRHQLIRRTFVLDASAIQSLKKRTTQHHADNNVARPPSTFLTIASHTWSCFVHAKALNPDTNTILCFLADCRTRLEPPVDEGYFGNCVRLTYAEAIASELIAEDRLAVACSKISKSISKMLEDPLQDIDRWISDFNSLPFARVTNVSASPRFKVYETDFGFGRPDRVELVSMNHDGEVSLVGGKEEGSVQVTVALKHSQMDVYAKAFLGDLHG